MEMNGLAKRPVPQGAPALVAREAVLQGTRPPSRDALRRRAAFLARQEVLGVHRHDLGPLEAALSNDAVDALNELPEDQRDRAWAAALGATDPEDAEAYAELELCERQAAEKRPLPPVIEPEPWRPDPKWGMNTGPPATDASHAFRSAKNRPASLTVGKPPPRGAPPPSPVRRLKVVDPVEERAASPLSRPLTARDDFPVETEDERNQRIESELAAQLGQLVGALQREDAEAEAREHHEREQSFLPPILPEKKVEVVPYKELLPPVNEAAARAALDGSDTFEYRPYPVNWSNLRAKTRTRSRISEDSRALTAQSSRSEANASLVSNRIEREKREKLRMQRQRQERLRKSRARAAAAKERRRKREGTWDPLFADAPAPLPARAPLFDDVEGAPAPAKPGTASTIVSSWDDTTAEYSDIESLATVSQSARASRSSFGSFADWAVVQEEQELDFAAPAPPSSSQEAFSPATLTSPMTLLGSQGASEAVASLATPSTEAVPAPAALASPATLDSASYVAPSAVLPGSRPAPAPAPEAPAPAEQGVEESKAEEPPPPRVDTLAPLRDEASSRSNSTAATPSSRLKRVASTAKVLSRAERKAAEKEAKAREKEEREKLKERTRQPVVTVRPKELRGALDSVTTAPKMPKALSREEKAAMRRTRRALGEEEDEEEKEYGIMDLGAINKRLAVESSKIQHLRRFTAEWEGDVEADFDSDSD